MTPDELRSLLSRATPGPWYAEVEPKDGLLPGRIGAEGHRRGVGDYAFLFFDDGVRPEGETGTDEADAAFIVALVNLAPKLLTLWKAAQKYRFLVMAGAASSDQLEAWAAFDDALNDLEATDDEPEWKPDAMDYAIGNTAAGHEHWDDR